MAVQITKEFITNVTLFVIAIVALGLSIGAIMKPCKDKFGATCQNSSEGGICPSSITGKSCTPNSAGCEDGNIGCADCDYNPRCECKGSGGSGGGSSGSGGGHQPKCGSMSPLGNDDCGPDNPGSPPCCHGWTCRDGFCMKDDSLSPRHSPSHKKSPSHHTGPTGPTHTQFDPRFGNGGKSVGGKGKSKQSSSEEESQDESGGEPNPHDLTWLWITLGSVGGVALLATLFLMMKKK
jgi:hypothetical protein